MSKSDDEKIRIDNIKDLEEYFDESNNKRFVGKNGKMDYAKRQKSLNVQGDTQIIGSPNHSNVVHPVLKLLYKRKQQNYSNSVDADDNQKDNFKIALVIEGGGMRGCVSAGMVSAIRHLGLQDCIDVVYGSSAGSMIGSYFITRQLQWFGPEIYYDCLTTAGKSFIDTRRILRAVGLGLLNPFLWKDVLLRPAFGKPVLNLEFLLCHLMQKRKPLDWNTFSMKQQTSTTKSKINSQPLKIVASSLTKNSSIVMDMQSGSFTNIQQLAQCMHASCLLPGIAGPLMNRHLQTGRLVEGNDFNVSTHEPLADALLFEPLPYQSAIEEGATHVIVLRTRSDGTDVTGSSSVLERSILNRFFRRKNKLPDIYNYMIRGLHKKEYAREILELNEMTHDTERSYDDVSKPHVLTIALPPESPEVGTLQVDRVAIFEGVRRGFARAYNALVQDVNLRTQGEEEAKRFFPNEILNYHPENIYDSPTESSFDLYLKSIGARPEQWKIMA